MRYQKTQPNIIRYPLRYKDKIIADFYYSKNDRTVGPIIQSFASHYQKLTKFFVVQPGKVNIHFIYIRQAMDKHYGKKSPRWLCGLVDPKSIHKIYLFSPLVFEKLTTHKKAEIIPTVIHETAHSFVSQINQKCFAWLDEGVCQLVEGKGKKLKQIKQKDWQWFKNNHALTNPDIKWSTMANHGGYGIALDLVSHIIKRWDRQTIIRLLKIKRPGNPEALAQKMSLILGQSVDTFLIDFEKKYNYAKEKTQRSF